MKTTIQKVDGGLTIKIKTENGSGDFTLDIGNISEMVAEIERHNDLKIINEITKQE